MGKKIDERSFEFALDVVALYKHLVRNKEYVLSKQILRARTRIKGRGARNEE